MAKGQMRNNREQKKPKKDKPKDTVAASPFASSFSKPAPSINAKKKK